MRKPLAAGRLPRFALAWTRLCSDTRNQIGATLLQSADICNVQYPWQSHADVWLCEAHICLPNEVLNYICSFCTTVNVDNPNHQRACRSLSQRLASGCAYKSRIVVISSENVPSCNRISRSAFTTKDAPAFGVFHDFCRRPDGLRGDPTSS